MSEVKGKLLVKGETKSLGTKGFTKREFVIETNSQYHQTIQLELTKDNCSLIDDLNIGDPINAVYNLNGRKWLSPQGEDKYFNSLVCWRINKVEPAAPMQPSEEQDKPPF